MRCRSLKALRSSMRFDGWTLQDGSFNFPRFPFSRVVLTLSLGVQGCYRQPPTTATKVRVSFAYERGEGGREDD